MQICCLLNAYLHLQRCHGLLSNMVFFNLSSVMARIKVLRHATVHNTVQFANICDVWNITKISQLCLFALQIDYYFWWVQLCLNVKLVSWLQLTALRLFFLLWVSLEKFRAQGCTTVCSGWIFACHTQLKNYPKRLLNYMLIIFCLIAKRQYKDVCSPTRERRTSKCFC